MAPISLQTAPSGVQKSSSLRPWQLAGCKRAVRLLCAGAALALAACASVAPSSPPAVESLLHDEFYPGASDPADRQSVLAMSAAMLRYADTHLSTLAMRRDPRQALLDALYKDGALRLSYDTGTTRNAAQAFDARAGNCLSLALMTAAFARHLGLPVSFREVKVDNDYTRSGDLVLVSGHVNLLLGGSARLSPSNMSYDADWVVDFLPGVQLRGQRSRPLAEETVVAMYFSNRAAEALTEGAPAEAYAWARMAVRADPHYRPAQNTLGVIYLRDGHMAAAEKALRQVLAGEPDNTTVLTNLALLLQRTQRHAEAATLQQRLARLQPDDALVLFDQGRQAMDRQDYAGARELFARELRRQPGQSEVLFWAALADWQLGDAEHAAQHLQQAVDASANRKTRELYAGKLARLKELRAQ